MPIRMSGRHGLKWKLLPVVRAGFRLRGGWNAFYAWMLDRQERNNSIEDILKRHARDPNAAVRRVKGLYDVSVGPDYVEFLKTEGLEPHHRILDFGCGYGRMAIPLLRYVNRGNYVGTDLSAERVRLARQFVQHEGLQDTDPVFHVARVDNDVSYLEPASYDFIWMHSVLGHMPLNDVRTCLSRLRGILKPDGVLIANYGFDDRIHNTNISAFWVPVETMRALVEELGFVYGETGDYWSKHIAPERESEEKMMRLAVAR